jgi:uncharacterized membrane protein SpoIIM required for sporulation
MSRELDLKAGVAQKAQAIEPVAEGGPAAHTFLWDWPTSARCGRAFLAAALVVFVVGVVVGAFAPGFPARILEAIQTVVLWPSEYFSQLVPIYLLILLANVKAAFLTALLGPVSVWVNAKLNSRHRRRGSRAAGSVRLPDRIACAVAAATVRAGRAVFPEIGDETREFAARSSAGLAVCVPFLALWMNGAVLGLWLAEGLLGGWGEGLVHVGAALLPHAPVEFTALILSAATGLTLARHLVPTERDHDSEWQARNVPRWLTSNTLAQSLGLLVGLLAIAAALELVALT